MNFLYKKYTINLTAKNENNILYLYTLINVKIETAIF